MKVRKNKEIGQDRHAAQMSGDPVVEKKIKVEPVVKPKKVIKKAKSGIKSGK